LKGTTGRGVNTVARHNNIEEREIRGEKKRKREIRGEKKRKREIKGEKKRLEDNRINNNNNNKM